MGPKRVPKTKKVTKANEVAKGHSQRVYTTFSCQLCGELDCDDMVACDQCDKWFHFVCVNVTRDIESRGWSCVQCKSKLNEQSLSGNLTTNDHSTKSVHPPKSFSLRSLKTESSSRLKAIVLQKLDEEQAIKLDILNKKYQVIAESVNELDCYEDTRQSSMDYTLRWAKKVQELSKDYSRMTLDDVSISLSDKERELVNQQSFEDLQNLPKSNLGSIFDQSKPMVDPKGAISRSETQFVKFGPSSLNNPEFNSSKESFGHRTRSNMKFGQHDQSDYSNIHQPQMNFELESPYHWPSMEFNVKGVPSRHESRVKFDLQPVNVSDESNVAIGFDSRTSSNQSEFDSKQSPNCGFGSTYVTDYQQQQLNYQSQPSNFQKKQTEFGFSQSPTVSSQPQPNFGQFSSFKTNQSQSSQPQPNFGQFSSFKTNQSRPIQPKPNFNVGFNQTTNVPVVQQSQLNNQVAASTIDYYQLCQSNVTLTTSQIAARHAMDKKLIRFYGEPKKWQMFESSFVNATILCGLNNAENLTRLLDCLKGDALETVQCRLLHPDSVPGVMNTLRLMYGRPELIIHTLLEDINKTVAPRADDLSSLVKFAISVQNLCATVKSYNATEHLRNPTLIKALTDKLPAQIQLNWAYYKHSVGDVNLSTLGDWLFKLAEVASDVMKPLPVKIPSKKEQKDNSDDGTYVNAHSVQGDTKKASNSKGHVKCRACNLDSNHKLEQCKKFKELSPEERWNLVKKNNICGGCFGNHRYYRCDVKKKCGVGGCNYNHHVLLHNDTKPKSTETSTHKLPQEPKTLNVHQVSPSRKKNPDIFRIVPIILSYLEKSIRIFAYLDDGSNLTTLEEEVARLIGAHGTTESLCVLWSFGDRQVEKNSKRLTVRIAGDFDDAKEYTLDHVRTVKKLMLPTQSITRKWLNQHPYFHDIPIATYEDVTPQMIIGLEYSKLMVSLETIEGEWNQPLVCRTRLGWVVQGPNDKDIDKQSSRRFSLNMCECQSTDNNLHQMVKEFFSIESFDVKIPVKLLESKELMRARSIMESSTVKIGNQYETALLWRHDNVELPNSYGMAKRRLDCVESRMKKDPVLATRMCNYIQDFIEKGYIRKLSEIEKNIIGPRTWYLPIFPVFNPKKPEKLRVVWDGAATVKSKSLNSMLLTGPDLLVPLPDILRRFRERQIGVTGDLKEMFHQILVNKADQDSQRFLWRDGDESKEPDVYVMQVMTFGSCCSPSLAQFVKNKNALDFIDKYPRAVEAITESHYVDDMIESAHSVSEAVELVTNVQHIHSQAGFELRSFSSNSKEVLQFLNGHDQCNNKILDDKVIFENERVLGMFWSTSTDTFTYSLKYLKLNELSDEYQPTKRKILRTVMSVFDPLGFLAHFVIYAKILLQDIWRSNVDWDDQLPDSLKDKWMIWLRNLPKVEELHIPRLYSPRLSPGPVQSIQLHMFVDASVEAYAAVAYFRIKDKFGVDICLVGAKSKVAPNKPMSVPRLELQGGVLGTRFINSIKQSHSRMPISKTIIWCDSKTVLSWINSDARRYNQFVAFRIGEILDSSESIEWRWIPSEYNVADEATKSKKITDLKFSSRWFMGPEFLRDNDSNWTFELGEPFQTEEEMRPCYLLSHLEVPFIKFIEYERFSNWQRLIRATAYVLRFIQNVRLDIFQRTGLLSSEELSGAENLLFKQAQFDSFEDEIVIIRWNETAALDDQKDFDKTSTLRTCSPYLDQNGVLRIKGRIDAAILIADSAKRPIILARNHYMTYLIVYWYHRKYLHLHHQTVLNEIKQKFWIPNLRVLLNSIRNNCAKCKNASAKPKVPEMASLPAARLALFTRPYTFTGVDYFGPITIVHGRSQLKRWGVLFTCMTTRGIHLEIAHSLNTSSCIMAVTSFIGRKGSPREIFSDNGTNFHGSDNALKAEFAKLDKDAIQTEFTRSDMKWTFNPPAASHMGGVWERMIRIVKNCLDEVLTVRYPTDEVLKNLFVQIENIVNSRPLTYVSLESPDDEVLTPNHFLLGSSNGCKPPGIFDRHDLLRNDWKTAQAMTDLFWEKFVLEYIPTLTRRTKWFAPVAPLKVGDVVVIADETAKRNTWTKAMVDQIHLDKEGKVRSASVRTEMGTLLTRPATKLAVLDIKKPEIIPKILEGKPAENLKTQDVQAINEEIHNELQDVQKMRSLYEGKNVVDEPLISSST